MGPRKRSSSRWCPAGLRTNPRACAARAARRDSEGARYHPAARSLAGAASAPTPGSAPPRLISPASPTAGPPRGGDDDDARPQSAASRARRAVVDTIDTAPSQIFLFLILILALFLTDVVALVSAPDVVNEPVGWTMFAVLIVSPPSSSSTARAAISISSPSSSGWISSARSPSSRTFPGSPRGGFRMVPRLARPCGVEGSENRRSGHERLGEGGAGGDALPVLRVFRLVRARTGDKDIDGASERAPG